jgi:hypothetical protein
VLPQARESRIALKWKLIKVWILELQVEQVVALKNQAILMIISKTNNVMKIT